MTERSMPGMNAGDPPPEVLEALDTAACVLDELRSRELSLSLSVQTTGRGETVHAEVRDHTGSVVCELTNGQLLELLSGTALDTSFHSRR